MNSVLCISVIAVFLAARSTANYCTQKNCHSTGLHTLCRFPNPQPAAACGKVISTGFNQAEKDEIVNTHNRLRQYVAAGKELRGNPGPQPAAKNMKILTWDNELAEIAQRWVNQCQWGHDKCRSVDRFYVGQNIALTESSGSLPTTSYDSLVNLWYDEVKDMDRNNVYKYKFAPKTGHYTQVVWANTEKVGCGQITYQEGGWNKYYMACNYGPGGNVIGEPIYQTK